MNVLKYKKIAFIILGVFMLMATSIMIMLKFTPKFTPKFDTVEVPSKSKDIGITQKKEINLIEEEDEDYKVSQEGIQNILLIGVDEGGYDNARSDTMIIATIDADNKVIKLTSIMRDTLANIPTSNTYQKLNHAYAEGGPVETMKAINKNFDLNIEDFVVFDFNVVAKAVDLVGGYPVIIDNGQSKDMKLPEGPRVLDGQEAINYMRARSNSGGNAGRNERQRDLILYIVEYAKDMNKMELIKLATKILPDVRTSYSITDIEKFTNIYMAIKDGLQTEQYNFPYEYEGKRLKDNLWYAVPQTMLTNVIELHRNIFGMENYVPSKVVDDISEQVSTRSGVY